MVFSRFVSSRGPLAALTLLGLSALPQAARAQTTVVPNAFAATAGDGVINSAVNNGDRTYQMQIAASQLGALSVGSIINGLTFRMQPGALSSVTTTFTNWDLTLAQATNTIAGMSNTFADNMTNPVSVRSGALTLAAGAFPGGSNPNAFGSLISFTTPYTYQGGDLVIHISHTAGSATAGFMDSVTTTGAGYGTDFKALRDNDYGSTTATATTNFTITQLSFSAAPEPGTLALLALGIVGGALARRRK